MGHVWHGEHGPYKNSNFAFISPSRKIKFRNHFFSWFHSLLCTSRNNFFVSGKQCFCLDHRLVLITRHQL